MARAEVATGRARSAPMFDVTGAGSCTVLLRGVQCTVICTVVLARNAEKQLRAVPRHIAAKLLAWIESVEAEGLEEVRKVPGFHDEPLKGDRAGQRSIRLSRSWRAIYVVVDGGVVEFARVEEVSHHEY